MTEEPLPDEPVTETEYVPGGVPGTVILCTLLLVQPGTAASKPNKNTRQIRPRFRRIPPRQSNPAKNPHTAISGLTGDAGPLAA